MVERQPYASDAELTAIKINIRTLKHGSWSFCSLGCVLEAQSTSTRVVVANADTGPAASVS